MDARQYNQQAWDQLVERQNEWTQPVDADTVARARTGDWEVVLTPTIPVPRSWFPEMKACRILGLACGGGQQGPIFAATGAEVTILDNSPKQLEQDRQVAERNGLEIRTVEGDMADLRAFAEGSFDIVFNPCSNCFAETVLPIWRECARVLRGGGILMTGFSNPAMFIFDAIKLERGQLEVRHVLPYSELTDITDEERQSFIERGEPLMFGHTLQDQIGGQLAAGFQLTDMFEDRDPKNALSRYMATYTATRAVKM